MEKLSIKQKLTVSKYMRLYSIYLCINNSYIMSAHNFYATLFPQIIFICNIFCRDSVPFHFAYYSCLTVRKLYISNKSISILHIYTYYFLFLSTAFFICFCCCFVFYLITLSHRLRFRLHLHKCLLLPMYLHFYCFCFWSRSTAVAAGVTAIVDSASGTALVAVQWLLLATSHF